MKHYIMSITAKDRPGIVAQVSEAGLALDGTIEAASQTVHQGYFAMMILWGVPDSVDQKTLGETVERALGGHAHVYVTAYEPPQSAAVPAKQSFVITCICPDKAGILAALSSYLASKHINIDDLYACVKQGEFVVICQVSVPDEQDVYMLQEELESVGRSLGAVIHMQHENIFVATNELPLHH